MLNKFKCCETKEFKKCICLVCFGTFRPSCLERNEHVIVIGGYRVNFSTECQLAAEEEEYKVKTLIL